MTPNATPFRFPLRTVLTGAVLAVVLAGCGSKAAETGAPPPPSVSVAPVLLKEISQWDEFSGRIEPVESVELRPRVSGYIDKVNYAEGTEVKKGDVLFSIDDRSYRAEFARANAALVRARTQASLARSEATRARKLSEQQAISTETWEQRRAAPTRPMPKCWPHRPPWTPPSSTWTGHACVPRSTAAPGARWLPPATWSPPATAPAC